MLQLRRLRQRRQRHALQHVDAAMPDLVRRAKQRRLIHQTGGDEGRRNRRPALHHQPGDAAVGERLQHGRADRDGRPCASTRNTSTPLALRMSSATGDAPGPANTQTGTSRAVPTIAVDERNAKPGVENDPHRRALEHARQPAGQVRIVGQHRADADQNRVGLRAHLVHALPRRLAGDADRLAAGEARLAVGRTPQASAAPAAGPRASAANGRRGRARPLPRRARFRPRSRARGAWRSPAPRPRGLRSSSADTTRAMPARMMASTHGGVLP